MPGTSHQIPPVPRIHSNPGRFFFVGSVNVHVLPLCPNLVTCSELPSLVAQRRASVTYLFAESDANDGLEERTCSENATEFRLIGTGNSFGLTIILYGHFSAD